MSEAAPTGLVLGTCPTILWAMTGEERARRTLSKAGAAPLTTDIGAAGQAGTCLMVRADWVIDPALVGILFKEAGTILVTRTAEGLRPLAAHVSGGDVAATAAAIMAPAGQPQEWPGHLRVIEHDPALPSIYLVSLRKRLKPAVLPLTDETVHAAEKATFSGAYKGVTDLVTKYVWPAPALRVTRWCANMGLSPNNVTFASLLLVFVATALFAQGHFALGLVAAWIMTFLDTVDGKLARCTLTSSKWGNVFDHGIDMIHPPFWWLAWHWGCLETGASYPLPTLCLTIAFGGYVVLRLQEGAFIIQHGFQMHIWRRFDSLFRLIVARRNPNLILLTLFTLVGEPGWGMVSVAVWTVLSIAIHLIQLGQGMTARRKGPLSSWLAV